MEPSLMLRKLPESYKSQLCALLDAEESWKKLMAKIPKTLDKENFACDITRHIHAKYNSQHFKLVETASTETKRSPTQILLQDWETSGRIHATLGHLLYLLTKAELFSAADYVAVSILKQQPPSRPNKGPAALFVDIKPPQLESKKENTDDIERILDNINYPSSVIENIIRQNNTQNKNIVKPVTPPAIVISESPDEDTKTDMFIPLVIQNPRNRNSSNTDNNNTSTVEKCSSSQSIPQISALMKDTTTEHTVSDMIKFSTNNNVQDASSVNVSQNIPCLSGLMNDANSNRSQEFNNNCDNNSNGNEINSQNIPQLSALMENNPSCTSFGSQCIPNLSALSQEMSIGSSDFYSSEMSSESISSGATSQTDSNNVPCLSNLLCDLQNLGSEIIPHVSTLNTAESAVSSNPTSRSSPLPNLSLNTNIPHFTYEEILKATDDFSTVDFREAGGRFLGAGAFGSVFLALGLADKPMAVKKLNLTNVNLVDENDIVTKQFKNEVEILGKYRHENLLSLVGYSCDGCTYCLLYDYLPGGALFERLKSTDNILSWMERMDIALGTAKGIAYLHTASSVPLVHRDIKSANILLDAHKKPKVCDFGLVKLVPDQNTSCTTTVIGTSAYMSPEAFRGDISVKVDTFSFGVVVLELLTSLPPVDDSREGRDLVTHVMDKCEDDITLLLDKKAGTWRSNTMNFADELYKIVQRCLEDKRQRPTMVDVTKSLEKLVTCM